MGSFIRKSITSPLHIQLSDHRHYEARDRGRKRQEKKDRGRKRQEKRDRGRKRQEERDLLLTVQWSCQSMSQITQDTRMRFTFLRLQGTTI